MGRHERVLESLKSDFRSGSSRRPAIFMTKTTTNLVGLTRHELEELAVSLGQQRFRGRQLYRGIYGRLLQDFSAFTDLELGFRRQLAANYEIAHLPVLRELTSRDESIRYLLGLPDGASIEAVCMPWRFERRGRRPVASPSGREPLTTSHTERQDLNAETEEPRTTLCISSQVGCAVGCRFCFTGLLGAGRNLTPGEIVGQVLTIAQARVLWGADAKRQNAGSERGNGLNPREAPRMNIVFMGQGEPLLNLDSLLRAVEILADSGACGVPLRRITISTAGIVPRIYDLARQKVRPKLAISLNASNDEQRDALMPINRKYPLSVLLQACRSYPLRTRERLTFEYVMLKDLNDSDGDAARVARLLAGIPARVNLIPYNGGTALPYRSSPLERVYGFEKVLRERGVPTFIRISRGQDIMAACGQLSLSGTS
jgi:23S rRNA (adenine2503-C2)-methyltransferase